MISHPFNPKPTQPTRCRDCMFAKKAHPPESPQQTEAQRVRSMNVMLHERKFEPMGETAVDGEW